VSFLSFWSAWICADECRDQKEGVGAFLEKRKPDFKASLEKDAPREYPWWSEVDIDPQTKGDSKL